MQTRTTRTTLVAGVAVSALALTACGEGAFSADELEEYALEADSSIDAFDCENPLDRIDGATTVCTASADDADFTIDMEVEYSADGEDDPGQLRFTGGAGSNSVDVED